MENKDGKNNKPAVPSADSVGMRQKRSVPRVIFGMLCRYAVALCGALGVCLMLEDGMRFLNVYYEPAPVFLVCFIFTSLWFLLFVSANTNIFFFCGTAAAYIAALVYLIVRNGLVRSFIYLPVTAWNHILMCRFRVLPRFIPNATRRFPPDGRRRTRLLSYSPPSPRSFSSPARSGACASYRL